MGKKKLGRAPALLNTYLHPGRPHTSSPQNKNRRQPVADSTPHRQPLPHLGGSSDICVPQDIMLGVIHTSTGRCPTAVGVCPTRRSWASQIRRRGDAEDQPSPPHHLAGDDDETAPWKDVEDRRRWPLDDGRLPLLGQCQLSALTLPLFTEYNRLTTGETRC